HDERGRKRHGPRSLHRVWNHQGARRHDLGRQLARRRRHVLHPPSARTATAVSNAPMNQPRVLIVDDDPALLQALPETLRLRMSGVTVDTADSAAAALDRIAAHDYDAIVTDIRMSGMDGLTLLAEIRGRRPDTPTLMITGHGEEDLAVRALRGGGYDFVQKPIERDSFVASLHRAIPAHARTRRGKERRLARGRCAVELA